MPFFPLLLAILASSAHADIPDPPSSVCSDEQAWKDRGREVDKKSFAETATFLLEYCQLERVPDFSRQAYRVHAADLKDAYCAKKKDAAKEFEKAFGLNEKKYIEQCDSYANTLTIVRQGKTQLQELQIFLKSNLLQNLEKADALRKKHTKLIENCDAKLLREKLPECVKLREELLVSGKPKREIDKALADSECEKNVKNALANLKKLKQDFERFWEPSAPLLDRFGALRSERNFNDARIGELESMERRLLETQKNCGGPAAAATTKDEKAPATSPTPTPNKAEELKIRNAADMGRCYSGECGADEVKAQQRAINEYIREYKLPIAPIAEDGIAGIQTANAWRAVTIDADRIARVSSLPEAPGAAMSASDYRRWDLNAQIDPATGYVIFKKGKDTTGVMGYFGGREGDL